MELLTPKEVARCLKISHRTVYENKNRLGGFYPAGLRVLRFRKEVINGIMEGQKAQRLEVQLPVSKAELRWRRSSHQSGGQKGKRSSESEGYKKFQQTNPARHGL
jgi:hypothetical protein